GNVTSRRALRRYGKPSKRWTRWHNSTGQKLVCLPESPAILVGSTLISLMSAGEPLRSQPAACALMPTLQCGSGNLRMRRDELRLLRWSQIDFEKKNITVGTKAKTEGGRGRVIPIGPMLEAILSTHASWYG